MGKIYVVIGKSATGKDTIYQKLLERFEGRLKNIVLYTTRPMRDLEVEGREYHFVDEANYQELEKTGKIIEARTYDTVFGLWRYFTVKDGQFELESNQYLMTGTLEQYCKIRDYFGAESVVPIYVDVESGLRLERALQRERKQSNPKYTEMCRRFIADEADFSEEKIREALIERRFENIDLAECIDEISSFIEKTI